MLKKLKLSTKMILLGLGGIASFTLVLGWVYFKTEAKAYKDKEVLLRNVTEIAFNLISHYDALAMSGALTMEEARNEALSSIKGLRYSKDEYFWINDLNQMMLMHPIKPEMDGKDQTNYRDSNGKQIFVEFVNVAKEKGEGLVAYTFSKPGGTEPVPKFSYIRLFKPWGWVVGSGVYIDDVQKEVRELRNIFLGVFAFLSISGVLVTLWMARSTTLPIYRAIQGLTSSASQVAAAVEQVSSASQQLAEGASEQAAALEETSSSLEEMSSMTKKTADNANQADQLMKETSRIVGRANGTMTDLTTSMQEITKASEETQKIIKTIDEIAFQTNLLALNAAVEAARAGESGAGFAVVADEVRNLAMRAAESARNTATLIESTVGRINKGSELVEATNKEFSDMSAMVTKSSGLVGEIAAASNEQAQGIEHLNKAISEMDKVVQQNAATAEETASASQTMNAETERMESLVQDVITVVGTGGGMNGNGKPSEKIQQRLKIGSKSLSRVSTKLRTNELTPARREAKELNPRQVIPLDEEDFKDF